jgi:DNA adenine methylase
MPLLKPSLKTPITYYGGKQRLCAKIINMLPLHRLYCEPFFGGGAVFFAKEPSEIEVINDTNGELINFYKVVKNDFVSLEKEIRISLHSRELHRRASAVYNNPDMFSEVKRAWALWVLSHMSFSSIIDGSFGYDRTKNSSSNKINNARMNFTEEYAIRLQTTQIESTDALRIIESRDTPESLFYCDPPYYNSDCGHYDGYSLQDFENLLKLLSKIKGKFILSSYPSPILKTYTKENKWNYQTQDSVVSVAKDNRSKIKTEVLTYNFA